MKSFKTYLNDLPIIEDIGKYVQDAEHLPSHARHDAVAKSIRGAIKRGEDTGLEDSKPKMGSSRAVYFPKEHHPIHIDGKDTHIPTVMKVAFHGHLDKYNNSGKLLGEHQNLVESDRYNTSYSTLVPHPSGHGFTTNHDGVVPPMLHSHAEGHYNLVGRVRPIKEGEFRQLTKTPEFPKGISHKDMYDTLNHHYQVANGNDRSPPDKVAHYEKISEHPFVAKMHDFVASTGQHPTDLVKHNMGVWDHPTQGTKHIVASDYGYSTEVAKHYGNAIKAKRNADNAKYNFLIGRR